MTTINTFRVNSVWTSLLATLFLLVLSHTAAAQGCGFVAGMGCPGTDYSNFGWNSRAANASDIASIEYDNFIGGYHATMVRTNDGSFQVWGANMAANGTSNVLSPLEINSTNYPGLSGTVLKAALGDRQANSQRVVLTTEGLYIWGYSGSLISTSVVNSTDFQKLEIGSNPTGLPIGVAPTDVKMLFGTYQTLAIVTCDGHVWVISQHGANTGSGNTSASATVWHQVIDDADNPLSDIKAVRGTPQGLVALKYDGDYTLWTWGRNTFLGDNTPVAARTKATQMTLPSTETDEPIKMIGMSGLEDRAASYYVLYANGHLYALGDNYRRQLGDWSTTTRTGWVQPQYSNTPGDVMNDIRWISPQEHDELYATVNVLTNDATLYNWGSGSYGMLGQGSGTSYDPGVPNGIVAGDKIIAVESGGHTTMVVKMCEVKFGYVGHRVDGSMGDGTSGDTNETAFTFETAEVQICGAASVPTIDAVEIGGGTFYFGPNDRYCNGSSIVLLPSDTDEDGDFGGVFTIVAGSASATLTGAENNILTFTGTGNTSVTIRYTVTTAECGIEVTSERTFLTEDCGAELTLEKSAIFNDNGVGDNAGDNAAQPEETITYTFTLTNTGDYWIDNLEISDPLFQAPNPVVAITLDFSEAEQNGVLQPGEFATAIATYTVTQSDIDNGGVYNRATVTGDYIRADGDELQVTDESSDPDPLVPGDPGYDAIRPDHTYTGLPMNSVLALVKSGVFNDENEDTYGQPGETITYTFTVSNGGNVTVDGISVSDVLLEAPNPVVAVTAVADSYTGTGPYGGSLAPGESVEYTADYVLTQGDVDNGGVTNAAVVTGDDPEGDPVTDDSGTAADNDDGTETGLPMNPVLALVKSGVFNDENEDTYGQPGETITYTFTVSNGGNVTVDGISVSDVLLEAPNPVVVVTAVADSYTGTGPYGGSLAPGESVEYTADYVLTQGDVDNGGVTNAAVVTGDDPEGDPVTDDSGTAADNDDDTETGLPMNPVLALVKTFVVDNSSGTAGRVDAGDEITYTFEVTNTGNVTLTDVGLSEIAFSGTGDYELPADAVFVPAPGGSAAGTLLPGETATYTLTYILTQDDIDAGELTNSTLATGTPPAGADVTDVSDAATDADGSTITDPETTDSDEDGEDGNDPVVTDLPSVPSIDLVKTFVVDNSSGTAGRVDAGDEITYTFEVTNTGNVTLTDVGLSEIAFSGTGDYELPADAVFVPAPGGSAAGTLLPGETATYTLTYTLTQDDIDAGELTNSTLATGTPPVGADVTDESDTATGADGTAITGPETTDSDGDGEDGNDPTDTTLPSAPSIDLVKTFTVDNTSGTAGRVDVGDKVTFTFEVTNTGNVTLTDVGLSEIAFSGTGDYELPTDAVFGSASENSSEGTLVPGETATYTLTYILTQDDIDAGKLTNSTLATGTPPAGADVTDESDTGTDADGIAITDPLDTDSDGDGDNNNDPTETTLPATAGIDLVKAFVIDQSTGNTNRVDAGDQITYTFEVTNTGNVTLTGVALSELAFSGTGDYELPADAVFVSSTEGSDAGTLVPGEKATYTLTYTLTQDDIDAGELTNNSRATGTPPSGAADNVTDDSDTATGADGAAIGDPSDTDSDGDGDNGNDPTETALPASPGIDLVKTFTVDNTSGTSDRVDAGDKVTYTFNVTNTGNVTLTGVELTEITFSGTGDYELPADAAFGSASEGSTVGTLLPGETATYILTYTLTQEDIDAGTLNNSSRATGTSPASTKVTDESDTATGANGSAITDPGNEDSDGDGDNGNDPTDTELPHTPSLAVTKTITSEGPYDSTDDVITYDIVVTNTGNVTIDGIVLTDANAVIPTGEEKIGTLAPGASKTIPVTHDITLIDLNNGSVSNQAQVSGKAPNGDPVTDDSDDPGTGDPDDATVIDVTQAPELTVTKVITSEGPYDSTDDVITYDITVTNTGNVTVKDIVLTDGNAVIAEGEENIGTLEPTKSATVTVTHAITQDDLDNGSVSNKATATGIDPKGNTVTDDSDNPGTPDDPDDATDISVTQQPELIVTKTAREGEHALIGDVITYDITVTNAGNVSLTNIVITDANADAGSITPATITTLAPEESRNATATHTITQADIDAGYVYNIAQVTGEAPNGDEVSDESHDPDPLDPDAPTVGDCTDCTITPIEIRPAVALVAVATNTGSGRNGAFIVGDKIEYRFTVTNRGNTTLAGFVLNDTKLGLKDVVVDETLAPGESFVRMFRYTITQEDILAKQVVTSATVNAESPTGTATADVSGDEVTNDVPTLVPVAEGPESSNDEGETPQNTPVTVNVVDNDEEGSSELDPATVRLIDPETGEPSEAVTIPGEGTYTVGADGTITFTPIREFYGESTIQYVVRDVNGLEADPAAITVAVAQSQPAASDDTQQGSFNGPVQIQLVSNDQPDTAPLDPSTIEITSQPQHGTLEIGADGIVTYSPNQYYTGPDEFSYRVMDANGNWTNVATVQITVSGFNIPNIITPNGDGQNDRFVIVGLADYDNAEVLIFNRWGNEVYRSNSYKQDWDAQGISEGTYYYLITLRKDGKETVHKGWLVIKRK
ncbi:DUF7507 domain-containing protein [Parapedobacter indicus]|uniref:Conserved repeat domain-containing protein/gliding motility-associated C-terminal domain-containing protein n=1 Tax=Parapedobacter indicus TaxID=1477437 RepID=A0A1I3CQ11_9SPHI|nr:gliding motility-associated C-terminal domain-containing protein [Parapedobacter indicus]SFH76594.1 conserved repeat domain-containing protein/gliding motility-associated C-terminal domain-containing protein [Parapedobacter indicus]